MSLTWKSILLIALGILAACAILIFVYVYVTKPDPTRDIREDVARRKSGVPSTSQALGQQVPLPGEAQPEQPQVIRVDTPGGAIPSEGTSTNTPSPLPFEPGPFPAPSSTTTISDFPSIVPTQTTAPPASTAGGATSSSTNQAPPLTAPGAATTAQPRSPVLPFPQDAGSVTAAPVPGALVIQTTPIAQGPTNTDPQRRAGGTNTKIQRTQIKDRFLFNNTRDEILGSSPVISNNQQAGGAASLNLEKFAPIGEDISVVLMDNVASNNFEVSAVAAVWFDFYFQGNLLLHTGTKLLGTASAGKTRDRVLITFDRIVFTDGKSMGISAIALNQDGTVGVPGFLIGNILLSRLAPILLSAIEAAAQGFKDRIQQPNLLTGVTTTVEDTNSPKNVALDSSIQVIQKIQELINEDLEENKPYVLVPAGTRFKIRLQGPIDTSTADYGK